jgi:E3 ubiquitin-protein ligase DOA10
MEAKECRICLHDIYTGLNWDGGEWLSPCRCKGSARWVHRGCLEDWIRNHALTSKQKTQCCTCR